MDQKQLQLTLTRQRLFFLSGKTQDVNYRLEILKKIRSLILQHEKEIQDALWKDFHKPVFEVIATETRFVLKELNYTIRNLKRWSRPRRVSTPVVHFISRSQITYQAYGQVLILSPWNYPFQLAFLPVIGALAAGNCVVLKTSRQVPECNVVMEKIIDQLPEEFVIFVTGDHDISDYLLGYKFDFIFFTGSTRIGKHVMQKASENMVPVALELGGKNPTVVAADAKLGFAAKRIAWGKFLNAGQTCICSDYVLIDNKVKDRFLDLIVNEIKNFYGDNPENSDSYARIINSSNTQRVSALIKSGRIVTGGKIDEEGCYVAPTVITDVSVDSSIMQEEIFGPVLPVIGFDKFEDVYDIIEKNPGPLAIYIFTHDSKLAREFLSKTRSGTAAVNETVMQIASPYLPYGGMGESGMGRYHGKESFRTFSNTRSVLIKSNLLDIALRYPPYTRFKEKALAFLLR